MKSAIALINGGAAAVWKSVPTVIKWPVVIGMVTLSVAELTTDSNHALQSGAIFGGQGAQGKAQTSDPVETRRAMNAGKPVSGAERMIAVQYEKEDAAAREQMASAAAATESPRELRAKDERGEASSTEALRLRDLDLKGTEIAKGRAETALRQQETRERGAIADAANESEADLMRKEARGTLTATESLKLQEIRRARAETGIKEAENYSAPAQARLNKQAAEFGSRVIQSMTGNGKGGGFDINRLSNNILNGRY
jgi:hypothetical protein